MQSGPTIVKWCRLKKETGWMRGRSYIKEVLEKQNDLRKEIPTIGREMDS